MKHKLIAFIGLAGCGKTTCADYLVTSQFYTRVKFADPLKNMLRAIGLGHAEIEGHLKEVPIPLLQGKTPRFAMQTLGTEWGRKIIGEEFWVGLWANTTQTILDNGGLVVVDDARFENELNVVKALGGLVVHMNRPGLTRMTHESEALDYAKVADITIDNIGSIHGLLSSIDYLVKGGDPAVSTERVSASFYP